MVYEADYDKIELI